MRSRWLGICTTRPKPMTKVLTQQEIQSLRRGKGPTRSHISQTSSSSWAPCRLTSRSCDLIWTGMSSSTLLTAMRMASIKKRPNGTWRARYRDAAGKEHARHFKFKDNSRDPQNSAQHWLDEECCRSTDQPDDSRRCVQGRASKGRSAARVSPPRLPALLRLTAHRVRARYQDRAGSSPSRVSVDHARRLRAPVARQRRVREGRRRSCVQYSCGLGADRCRF